MLTLFFNKLKALLQNPMILVIYGFLVKYYVMIVVAAITVMFWFFTGLKDLGVLQSIEEIVAQTLTDTKSVARYCVPKIFSFTDFWDCLNDPPAYQPSKQEQQLEKGLTDLLDLSNYGISKDPYAK